MWTRRGLLTGGAALCAGLAGCGTDGGTGPTEQTTPAGRPASVGALEDEVPSGPYRYSHPAATGNRSLGGGGDVRGTDPIKLSVEGRPQWLVCEPLTAGTAWTVLTDDGTATRWRVADGEPSRLDSPGSLPAGSPPVLAANDGAPTLVTPPPATSPRSGVAVAPDAGPDGAARLLAIAENGDLLVVGPQASHRFDIDAPTDARPAAVGDGRFVVYGARTDRYGHGALGDGIEPSALLVVDPAAPAITAQATLDPPAAFEALQPLVADLDGDGEPEVVTTVADSADGARIAVFSTAGERLATGPTYGPGWRHQLVAAALGPDGGRELAVVLKPHVTRRLEYYRFDGRTLEVTATQDGFSTHTYGSRVIGGAVAADLDGEGSLEVLLPTGDRQRLAAVRRTAGGASVAWEVPLGSRVLSNLTGTRTSDGGVAVGVATSDAVLVWDG